MPVILRSRDLNDFTAISHNPPKLGNYASIEYNYWKENRPLLPCRVVAPAVVRPAITPSKVGPVVRLDQGGQTASGNESFESS